MYKVVAHRGFSDRYPENTRPALESAVELGVDMIELDVRLCQDGLVVFHDKKLDMKTNDQGRPEEKTVEHLLSLDNGSWFDPAFAGERMLTFEEAAEIIGNKTLLNIHLKSGDHNEELVAQTIEVMDRYNLNETAFIASDPTILEIVRSTRPDITRCLIEPVRSDPKSGMKRLDHAMELGCRYIQPLRRTVTPQFVEKAHANNIELVVYYANTRPHMHLLINHQVDYILTDRADLLLQVLREYEERANSAS